MLKIVLATCIVLAVVPAFGDPPSKYEVATITGVKQHQTAGDKAASGPTQYEISSRVGDTIYVVLYTDTLGTSTVKYAAGRQLLVHVGKDTITYNDILGQSHEVPIISQQPATKAKESK